MSAIPETLVESERAFSIAQRLCVATLGPRDRPQEPQRLGFCEHVGGRERRVFGAAEVAGGLAESPRDARGLARDERATRVVIGRAHASEDAKRSKNLARRLAIGTGGGEEDGRLVASEKAHDREGARAIPRRNSLTPRVLGASQKESYRCGFTHRSGRHESFPRVSESRTLGAVPQKRREEALPSGVLGATLSKVRSRASSLPPPSPARIDRSRIRVRRFAGPASFEDRLDPIRIAHLTDLHVGRVTPMRVQLDAVELTNEAHPDLVVVTGDFVCHSQRYLDELSTIMSGFRAPVVAVLGNHDYWSGAEGVRWALGKAGVTVLDNTSTILTLRGQSLQLVGLDDAYTGHADRLRAVHGLRPDVPTIGLSHIAEEADFLWDRGVPLVLSGHTHAGQITLARLHELSIGKLAGHKYVHGLYGTRTAGPDEGAVYVGAGIGAAVMPLRLGERGKREIAIFELGHAPGTFDEHHAEQAPLEGRAPTDAQREKRKLAVEKKRARRERRDTLAPK